MRPLHRPLSRHSLGEALTSYFSVSAFQRFSFSAAIALYLAATAIVQGAIDPPDFSEPTESPLSPAEVQALQAPPSTAPAPLPAGAEVSLNGRPVSETPRRFKYVFSLTVRGVYDDNINISSFNKVSDYYFAIEPSIFLGLGAGDAQNSLSLTYRPSIFLFVDQSENDAVQHILRLTGARRLGHLSFTLSQDIQILDGQDLNSISDPTGHQANIDIGGRSRHQIYTSGVGASYDLTGKLFLSGGGAFAADQYDTLISSQSFSGNLFLNYNYSDKLVVGVGGTGGYNTVENASSDQTYEQANIRLNYTATAKISLSASGGIEFRQSDSGGNQNISPVYELNASYQPFDGTSIGLTGSRRTMNSASLAGQDFSDTTLNVSVNQRLVQRVFVGLAAGYTNSEYFSVIDGVSATRSDNYYYVEPTIDMNVTRFWTFGAYFLHRENSSNFNFFTFDDNQVGIRSKLTF
jgi:hypothetical protein